MPPLTHPLRRHDFDDYPGVFQAEVSEVALEASSAIRPGGAIMSLARIGPLGGRAIDKPTRRFLACPQHIASIESGIARTDDASVDYYDVVFGNNRSNTRLTARDDERAYRDAKND
jgi:hypothetical protein